MYQLILYHHKRVFLNIMELIYVVIMKPDIAGTEMTVQFNSILFEMLIHNKVISTLYMFKKKRETAVVLENARIEGLAMAMATLSD